MYKNFLVITGIDYITPSISIPYNKCNSGILELNPSPGIDVHYYAQKPWNRRQFIDGFVKNLFKYIPTNRSAMA